jgi:hypothetical protein
MILKVDELLDHFMVPDERARRFPSAGIKIQAEVIEGASGEAQVHSGVV